MEHMGVTKKSFVIAAVLLATALALTWFVSSLISKSAPPDTSHLPTMTGTGFSGLFYAADGKPENALDAETLVYYEKDKRLELTDAHLIHYRYGEDRKTGDKWHIESDNALILIDQNALLTGNVILYPADDNPAKLRLTDIKSDTADYDFQTEQVSSPDPVTILGPNYIDRATGFVADLKLNQVTLKGEPHGTYFPANQ